MVFFYSFNTIIYLTNNLLGSADMTSYRDQCTGKGGFHLFGTAADPGKFSRRCCCAIMVYLDGVVKALHLFRCCIFQYYSGVH